MIVWHSNGEIYRNNNGDKSNPVWTPRELAMSLWADFQYGTCWKDIPLPADPDMAAQIAEAIEQYDQFHERSAA
jgi:hypothetical protein